MIKRRTTADRAGRAGRGRTAARARLALAFLVVASGCGGASSDALPDVPIVPFVTDGAAVSADVAATPVSVSDIEGPAVINLWATWCTPCRKEIPDFEAVHRARGDVVRFVGINVGEDADQAAAFLAEVGATYDQYLDPTGEASTAFEATSLPATLVIDNAGTIVKRQIGPMNQDDLNVAIDAVVGS